MKQTFVEATGVPAEFVKVFYSTVRRMDGPQEAAAEVYWMRRPQEACDRAAQALTAFFQQAGCSFVQVTFAEFSGSLFYENGVRAADPPKEPQPS